MKCSLTRLPVFPFSRLLVFTVVATLLIAQVSAFDVIDIPDPNLKQVVRESLKLPDEIPLTRQEMLRLHKLDAVDRGITALTGLEHATFLEDARFDRNQISDLRPLAGLVNLEILELRGNPIVDISPLMNLANLERLTLIGNQIDDISPLSGLLRLTNLILDENQVVSLSPLMNLANLTHLGLNGNQIDDISPLANLTQLRHIGLARNQIRDINPLAGLIRLESLVLNRNQISDISPLANLTNLKTLFLIGDRSISDITPLANLTQLMRLRLSGQSISDITPLANLTQLIHFRLDNNQIRDISSLANLTLLEELALNKNAITDITPLIGLKNLRELRLADNPIHDLRPLVQLEGVELDIEIDFSQLDKLNIVVEIPDPNLKQVIRETLSLSEDIPLTQLQMQRLTRLAAWHSGITDLTGLEYATSLQVVSLVGNQIQDLRPLARLINLELVAFDSNSISDISPLANLTNLKHLRLASNPFISDITPLQNLTNLTYLSLAGTSITDITSLANLVNLEKLRINRTLITDYTPLEGLTKLVELHYDEVCKIAPLPPSVTERIESRSFPSVVQAWGGIGWTPVLNRPNLSDEEHITLHDLYFSPTFQTLAWDATPTEPTHGLATQLAGNLEYAREVRQQWLDQNPNMVFLRSMLIQEYSSTDAFPPDSDFWLRDANGEIMRKWTGSYLVNFLKPEVQQLIIGRIIAIEQCGLYDGVMLDGFRSHGTGFSGRHLYPVTREEIIQAILNILRTVRAQVRDDFLILANVNETKPTRYAEFLNGVFMEIAGDHPGGYSHDWLIVLEDTLSWAVENLRSPQINCLYAQGIDIEPLDGPNNLRWMRVTTTMSMTHSDGYALYRGIRGNSHFWYPFWDADLGRPIGPKAQLYKDLPGLFIREFTNGWAVYNRSGQAQAITLPASATPVSDRGDASASLTHQLPDLDGEIYLKAPNPTDVNGDGVVNILDLVQVANEFGKSTPDPNGDGAVNILDLVFVAQQFSQ